MIYITDAPLSTKISTGNFKITHSIFLEVFWLFMISGFKSVSMKHMLLQGKETAFNQDFLHISSFELKGVTSPLRLDSAAT